MTGLSCPQSHHESTTGVQRLWCRSLRPTRGCTQRKLNPNAMSSPDSCLIQSVSFCCRAKDFRGQQGVSCSPAAETTAFHIGTILARFPEHTAAFFDDVACHFIRQMAQAANMRQVPDLLDDAIDVYR